MKLPPVKIEEAIQEVMKTREGRYFINSILRSAGVCECVFNESQRRTDFLLGRQSIGTGLVSVMKEHGLYFDFLKQLREDKENG